MDTLYIILSFELNHSFMVLNELFLFESQFYKVYFVEDYKNISILARICILY
jgi:hypothetical protein